MTGFQIHIAINYSFLAVEGYADSGGIPQEPAALLQAGEHHYKAPDLRAFTKVRTKLSLPCVL